MPNETMSLNESSWAPKAEEPPTMRATLPSKASKIIPMKISQQALSILL